MTTSKKHAANTNAETKAHTKAHAKSHGKAKTQAEAAEIDVNESPGGDASGQPNLASIAAYNTIKPEMDAVAEKDMLVVNLNIYEASVAVQGRVPRLNTFRSAILSALKDVDITVYDKLNTYALAVYQAQTLYQLAKTPPPPVEAMATELAATREVLLSDALALVKRKFLDGAQLVDLQGTTGYVNTGSDVMLIANLMLNNWKTIQGKTGVQLADLENAIKLAETFNLAVGTKKEQAKVVNEANETRQRAFTLFIHAYDQVRRGITYVRWHEDDVDTIAPPLYTGHGTSKNKTVPAQPTTPVDPAAPPAVASPTNGASNVTRAPDTNGLVNAPGMPGDHPFNH